MNPDNLDPILMNDFKAQWAQHRDQVLGAVDRVGKSGWLILGSEVSTFEQALANYWGLAYCTGCASGLDAIEIALRVTGLKAGEKVLTTPLSAFATSLAIVRAGGVPVFVDVDFTAQIDLELCSQVLQSNKDIRFMVPVHLYGHALEGAKLKHLRDQFGLNIIEDCAQAIGSRSAGQAVGSIGEFAATSFYPTKNLGCMGDGGALLTHSELHWQRARVMRDYGQQAKYEHKELGMNSRLDEVQAAILHEVFLPALDEATARRTHIAARYGKEICNPQLVSLPTPVGSESVWHLYPLLCLEDRSMFQEHLRNAGVSSGIHYPILIPDQAALEGSGMQLVLTSLEQAKTIADQEVSLPMHLYLTDEHVDRIVEACNRWRA